MKLSPKVLAAFSNATIEPVDETWHLTTLPMNQKDYREFKKVVNGMRGEWVRSLEAHVFSHDPTAEINAMLESGEAPSYVNNPHSFFPTPPEEVDEMVNLIAKVSRYSKSMVLEPSAGDGRIMRAVLKADPEATIHYCEIDERNRELLVGIKNATCIGDNFLTTQISPVYDYIIMNPPFNGSEYQKHVRRAFDLLRPGGCLVAIMPSNAVRDRKFRDWMFRNETARWYPGEHKFQDTNVNYVTVEMSKLPLDHESDSQGFNSYAAYYAAMMLDNDPKFHDENSRGYYRTAARLRSGILHRLEGIIRELRTAICTDDEVLDELTWHYAEQCGIEPEARPVVETQMSLLAA